MRRAAFEDFCYFSIRRDLATAAFLIELEIRSATLQKSVSAIPFARI